MKKLNLIDTVNDLVETCKDGEYGFLSCAEHAGSVDLKQLFTRRAEECQRGAAELQAIVMQHGGIAEDGGTARGAMHRGWVAVRGTLAGYSDAAMLEECERGEDTALARYRWVLESGELPLAVRSTIERQLDGVKRNHAEIRTLRERARAAHA